MRSLALLSVVLLVTPHRWVTDEAHVLSPAVEQQLEARLEASSRSTGHQVLVYVDRSTHGVPIEDWAARAYAEWKVGRAGLDDGVALFVFLDDHAARLEVGYGLEPVLTDARCSRILREQFNPRVVAGDVDGAVSATVDAVLATVGGTAEPVAPMPTRLEWVAIGLAAVLFLALLVWKPQLAWLLLLSMGRRRSSGGGGFRGGGGRSGGGGASSRW